MSDRKQRTPAEIIAETEAKLERLRIKQAKQDAKSDPTVAPMVAQLDELRKTIREARKGLGDGPQGFAARIAKHQRWIDKIVEEREVAELTLQEAEQRKAQVEGMIAKQLGDLADAMSASA